MRYVELGRIFGEVGPHVVCHASPIFVHSFLPDFPITAVVRDDVTGDLYAASDFGVMMLPAGTATWAVAGSGLPMVEVAGLTMISDQRILYFVVVIAQLWLLTATLNAWLGGDSSVVWPGLAASAACLALNAGLLRYL